MENLVSLLALLACPVGMGLMMWMMMRENKGGAERSMSVSADGRAAGRPIAEPDRDDRLAALRAQLSEVEAQQAVIAEQIARLSAEDRPSEPLARAPLPARPAEADGASSAKFPAGGRPPGA